jgi:AcrR family transcriptional regulator
MTVEHAGYSQRPSTEKGRARRDRIIAAATLLFYEGGYHATGIDEIGEASGITGPGVYRHFAGKDEILIAIFDRIWMVLKDGVDASRNLADAAALDVLVAGHVETAVERGAEVALLHRELRNLPAAYQAKARRNRRAYEDWWATRIVALHPEYDDEEGRMIARSVFWMINAYAADPTRPTVTKERAKQLLTSMAHRVIAGSPNSEHPEDHTVAV